MELRIDRLTKQYGAKIAVDRMDFTLKAGKTALMRMICDILRPTSGEVLYDGRPISEQGDAYRMVLGYLPQQFGYYPEFTANKFMMYMAALKGLGKSAAAAKTLELLELVGLSEVKNKKIKTFSGGMKQRLGIAQAMLNDPEILVLDEPTAGLDPKERVSLRRVFDSLKEEHTLLIATHVVSDVESIADEVIFLKQGKLIAQGGVDELLLCHPGIASLEELYLHLFAGEASC